MKGARDKVKVERQICKIVNLDLSCICKLIHHVARIFIALKKGWNVTFTLLRRVKYAQSMLLL